MKKYFYIIVAVIILTIAGGLIYWQKTKSQTSTMGATPEVSSPKPEPQYPKVTNWQVPILMYHYIRDASGESELGKNLSVSPENFERQLKWLDENGYQTMRVRDLTDPQKKAISKIVFEKKKPIILTFDDGYADAYAAAFPIMKKYQMIGTFYIIRGYAGREVYMNQEQIDELEANGMEIGSHTLSHPGLTKIESEEARRQIFDSKGEAETFCYPAGKYDATTLKLVQEAGYKAAVTTHFGIATENSSILELPRVRVEDTSGEILGQKIEAAFEQ